ncbi:MAG: gamma-glutamyl-gamma-aminobutyrate hydrolase family protein [Anaerolineales bacterium]|nr:gamma-glutamyl-gamma-aminobutyrate hydrolase family protein [Anaerolineales bacterium]MCA9978882.1 gamma-glutamyl-gamma-aminobutyrate hydrolase family protein [Anaerolineales bacterium]MCB8968476.1 gamma-glutamyl-gamma-aminobutyrate hydrolase family protein [Ardenticatenaceae bacterium]
MATTSKPLIGCTTYRVRTEFTVFALRPAYVRAIQAAGGIPVLIPLGLEEDDLQAIFARIDGLLIPGGGDIEPAQYHGQSDHDLVKGIDIDRDRIEAQIVRWAVGQRKPMLAICRGHQIFNVALGGSLWEDIYTQMPAAIVHDFVNSQPRHHLAHAVTVQAQSRLAAQMGATSAQVNSLHHQGIRELAAELTAVAHAPDGLIEAVEIPDHPYAIGVQWHPEDLAPTDPAMAALFQGLIEASKGKA